MINARPELCLHLPNLAAECLEKFFFREAVQLFHAFSTDYYQVSSLILLFRISFFMDRKGRAPREKFWLLLDLVSVEDKDADVAYNSYFSKPVIWHEHVVLVLANICL